MTGDTRFHELLKQIGEMHDRKQKDYGSDDDPFANVRASQEWGVEPWVGALVRLNDKVHRLQQFARKGELANESAEDSMLDIAVYSLIALILYREEDETEGAVLHPNQVAFLRGEMEYPEDDQIVWSQTIPAKSIVPGGQTVGTPTDTFKHKPCQRCETEYDRLAGQDPALD